MNGTGNTERISYQAYVGGKLESISSKKEGKGESHSDLDSCPLVCVRTSCLVMEEEDVVRFRQPLPEG